MRAVPWYLFLILSVSMTASCGKKAPPRWVDVARPEAPKNVQLYQRPGEVRLQWEYPEEAMGELPDFRVRRSTDGGRRVTVGKTPETVFVDWDVAARHVYEYVITARTKAATSKGRSVETPEVELPPAPTGLELWVIGDSVELHWRYPDPDALFNIYKATEPGLGSYQPAGPPVRGTVFTDKLSLAGPTYYSVRILVQGTPKNVVVESAASEEIALRPEALVPESPTGLDAVVRPDGVLLVWDEAPEPWVQKYRIYRSEAQGEFVPIGEAATPTFTDRDVQGRAALAYRVSALGPGGEGPLSPPLELKDF